MSEGNVSQISSFLIGSIQTRCIVKGEAQKNPLFWRFSGGFWFSQERLFSRNSKRKPLNLITSPIFTNTPCKYACFYNAPSWHTVDFSFSSFGPLDLGGELNSEPLLKVFLFLTKTLVTHSAAVCDSIAAIPPYSALWRRGQHWLAIPPPRSHLTPPST